MSFSGSSASKNKSWATILFADSLVTGSPKKIILSLKSLEYISKALSPRPVSSITIGIILKLIGFHDFNCTRTEANVPLEFI